MDAKALLTVEEVLAQLRISRGALYNLINSGELRYVKIRKRTFFRQQDIDEFTKKHIRMGKIRP